MNNIVKIINPNMNYNTYTLASELETETIVQDVAEYDMHWKTFF